MRTPSFALAMFLTALLCAALLPLFAHGDVTRNDAHTSPEWAEAQWLPANASPVRQPLTALEERFASRFPGHIARFSDGHHVWIVRVMNQPTRMLHPATDCFRGLGYQVDPPRVHSGAHERNWRCFAAAKNGKHLNVCERIFDAKDGNWTDASSWYWSALLGMHGGPWWAVTRVTASS